MLTSTAVMLQMAQNYGYAVGAFNVYNLEGVRAVVLAAEAEFSPAILQLHPAAIEHGGKTLVEMCMAAARQTFVPMSVHLDHSASEDDIKSALDLGLVSIMADGSMLSYEENVAFTGGVTALVHSRDGTAEAELGRLTGSEDDLTVPENLAKLTDPAQAKDFVGRTGVDALAVCIGNVHGSYRGKPELDFERLEAIRKSVSLPLVLHGASGLPADMISRSIELGVCKFNVNTEVRQAYVDALRGRLDGSQDPDLLTMMRAAVVAMQDIVASKLRLFGSSEKG